MTDCSPEGNADGDVWTTTNVPGWQAAVIRLGRPVTLWALGPFVMGSGTMIVGAIEAIFPGRGIAMATAMAALLRAYPTQLYWLVAFLFGGQALASIIKAWKGQ